MKTKFLHLFIIAAGLSVILLSSCKHCVHGSGNKTTENRKVSDFTKIDISGDFKVHLKQDSSLSVNISADDNLLKYIKTSVDGDKLKISSKKSICGSGELVITIGVRNLNEIAASGAVDIMSDGKVVTKDIHFDLSGATKVTMDLNAANVTTEGSGVTKMQLTGQATSHNLDLSGACKIEAFDFVVGNYNIETSGASRCQINVLTSLSVRTSGASKIEYRGNPGTVNNDKSGISSLKKVD